jgi:hypothetical protein
MRTMTMHGVMIHNVMTTNMSTNMTTMTVGVRGGAHDDAREGAKKAITQYREGGPSTCGGEWGGTMHVDGAMPRGIAPPPSRHHRHCGTLGAEKLRAWTNK